MLTEFNHRRSRDKNRFSIGLFQFNILRENLVLAFLKKRLNAFEKNVPINDLLIPFPAVDVVSLAQINFFALRLL